MPAGRPTDYRPEYCEELIEHMAEGLSFESFAAKLRTHKQILYRWAERHEEFGDAKKIGTDASRLFWEKMGRNGACGKIENFNSTAWIFNMKNRFAWRDKKDIELSGPDEGPIEIEVSEAEIKRRAQRLRLLLSEDE